MGFNTPSPVKKEYIVYVRRSTPRKTPELTQEDLSSIVDAAIDAASAVATSHTEVYITIST